MLYLDSNATTKPLPAVVDAVRECMESAWANPSSVHRLGVDARHRIELARSQVAHLVGCQEREIVFASGGTEAVNLAIFGTLESWRERDASGPAPVLITSRLEHSAVRESADAWQRRGGETRWLQHDPTGLVDLGWLEATLVAHASRPTLVSLMWANNETGVIQPIEKVGALCRTHGARFHTDATQWVGKMPTDVSALQVDLLSFAAHKFHGPKGVGALYLRRGVRVERQAIGGPQERDRRGGTENVAGIVGMGVAAAEAARWLVTGERERLRAERDRLERGLLERCPGAVVNGASAPRLWNTSNVGFPRLEAEAILLLLSERGICASAGAACSSGSLDPSPVLLAMGIAPELAHGSVRFSLSRLTTSEDVSEAIAEIPRAIEKLSVAMR
jgi:cysteine desulfurase